MGGGLSVDQPLHSRPSARGSEHLNRPIHVGLVAIGNLGAVSEYANILDKVHVCPSKEPQDLVKEAEDRGPQSIVVETSSILVNFLMPTTRACFVEKTYFSAATTIFHLWVACARHQCNILVTPAGGRGPNSRRAQPPSARSLGAVPSLPSGHRKRKSRWTQAH